MGSNLARLFMSALSIRLVPVAKRLLVPIRRSIVAEIFACDQVRIGMKKEDDIVWAQRAADEAKERKIRLVHHAESNTLFATFDITVQTLKKVNRRQARRRA